ncbi:MAG: dihydrofolate reductase family protein [Ginsengibacter sp.]
MRKLILSVHVSLDGFVAGSAGEMDWIVVDEEIFDETVKLTDAADTALYGRVTFDMMQDYWPKAGENPSATKHDKEHSAWYNRVEKVVMSRTLSTSDLQNAKLVGADIVPEIEELKSTAGKNILIFGSPGAAHTLMNYNLIDEYWLFVNPVILGNGIKLFSGIKDRVKLSLLSTKKFANGVLALNYLVVK